MKPGTAIAVAAVVLVVVAVGGVVILQRQSRPRALSPTEQIAAGIGGLVGGIVGVAVDAGSGEQ